MTATLEPRLLRELLKLLGGLRSVHEQLLNLVEAKIDAMKRADVPAMQELSKQEQVLAERLQEREGLRYRLMGKIAEDLGLPPQAARALPVSRLASRIQEPARAMVLDAAGNLREVVARVARANRVAGAISREVINHLKWVFASVRPQDDAPVGYSGDGTVAGPTKMRIFETVG